MNWERNHPDARCVCLTKNLKRSKLSHQKKEKKRNANYVPGRNLKDLTCCIHAASAGSCWHMVKVAVFPLAPWSLTSRRERTMTPPKASFPFFTCESARLAFSFFFLLNFLHSFSLKSFNQFDAFTARPKKRSIFWKCIHFMLIYSGCACVPALSSRFKWHTWLYGQRVKLQRL